MNYDDFKAIVTTTFPNLRGEQLDQFAAMDALYRDWNSKINVISRKDIDSLYSHHVLHSLAIAAYLKLQMPQAWERFLGVEATGTSPEEGSRLRVLDLGTGGGFPGIPLAVLFPEVDFTLCDSIGKKTLVARGVAESLDLKNVKVVNARAESLEERFDFVVSRAVTSLENFIPWVRGKYSEGILYLKGGDLAEEIANAMGRFRMRKGSVHTWSIENWLSDEFFAGKMVIFIEKQ